MGEEGKEKKNIQLSFPLVLIRTTRGMRLLERLAHLRPTKGIGWIFLYIFPIMAAISFYFIITSLSIYFTEPAARDVGRTVGPLGHLLLPGLNPYLPIVYGWIALIVGIAVHEGGHAVLARSFGLTVKSTGLILFLFVPIGAFAEVDDKELYSTKLRNSSRVLAAGPGSNMIIALITLLSLMLIVGSLTPMANGVGVEGVVEGAPVHVAGVLPGDIIVSINGIPTPTLVELSSLLDPSKGIGPHDTINLAVARGNEVKDYSVQLSPHPLNTSRPFLGIDPLDFGVGSPGEILGIYTQTTSTNPLAYLIIPTLSFGQQLVPFSDTLHGFYTSPIGDLYFPIANFLFWVWFVNFNLAIFNALPMYPLDGGVGMKLLLRASIGKKIGEKRANMMTYAIALAIFSTIILMIAAPWIPWLGP